MKKREEDECRDWSSTDGCGFVLEEKGRGACACALKIVSVIGSGPNNSVTEMPEAEKNTDA